GLTSEVVDRQMRAAISGLDRIEGSGLVIAYEPVWAIGTGLAATPDDAQTAAAQIRAILHEADPDGAHDVPILYGGSCTPENAAEIFAQPDVDGALVGGASLDADRFAAIVRAAAERAR
ncbi:MAG TPA: triose-phosphate isomerase, partial [Candidatus Limnocylindria bacterium]|nr:triose-phosphate isomerase [Candidatus Limnocylindria bacterium]